MLVRKLNSEGIAEFDRYLDLARENRSTEPPYWILDDDRVSQSVEDGFQIEQKVFRNRYEMGEYLAENVDENLDAQLFGDTGLWSWITLYWFDQFCPVDEDGNREVKKAYNYIPSSNYRHRYRHAIYMSWLLVRLYGKKARFLLSADMPVRGELIEQLMARQEILFFGGVMDLASTLYSDTDSGKFKRGAAGRTSPGCVSRYVAWLQQLALTYGKSVV